MLRLHESLQPFGVRSSSSANLAYHRGQHEHRRRPAQQETCLASQESYEIEMVPLQKQLLQHGGLLVHIALRSGASRRVLPPTFVAGKLLETSARTPYSLSILEI